MESFVEEPTIIEVYAEVESVEKRDRRSKGSNFTVITKKGRKTRKVECPFFCPIQEGDRIALCTDEITEDLRLVLKKPPLVYIGSDEGTLKECLKKSLMRSNPKSYLKNKSTANDIYELIKKVVTCANLMDPVPDLVDRHLIELSEDYIYTRDEALLTQFTIINPAQTKLLYKWWFKNRVLRQLYLFGLTLTEIRETDIRPSVLFTIIKDNPYLLPSLAPSRCESILAIRGLKPTEDQLKCGHVLREVYNLCKKNHWSYIPTSLFLEKFKYSLDDEILKKLNQEYGVYYHEENDAVYLNFIYESQVYIAEQFNKVIQLRSKEEIQSLNLDEMTFPEILSDDQKNAIHEVLSSKWSIITGPAGSGKTTLMKTLIRIYSAESKKCAIVAFTGKAVSRIMEVVTDDEATILTIHRFLARAKEDPNMYSHVFIDETSMVDISMFTKLLKRIEEMNCQLTMIGDPHQLPPISWISTLTSLLKCDKVKHVQLKKIHRTGETKENGIYNNSMKIREDKPGIEKFNNFNMIKGNIKTVVDYIKLIIQAGGKLENITVLCPYNKHLKELNDLIRGFVPPEFEVEDNIIHEKWKVGDLVMMNKNNYDIGIMNGETGYVTDISTKEITVTFKKYDAGNNYDSIHKFLLSDPSDGYSDEVTLDDDSFYGDLTVKYLIHAFAISIHKSQGSEWGVVILYIPEDAVPGEFINKNLLYTGITRAKKGFLVIGNIETFLVGCYKQPGKVYEDLHKFIK